MTTTKRKYGELFKILKKSVFCGEKTSASKANVTKEDKEEIKISTNLFNLFLNKVRKRINTALVGIEV